MISSQILSVYRQKVTATSSCHWLTALNWSSVNDPVEIITKRQSQIRKTRMTKLTRKHLRPIISQNSEAIIDEAVAGLLQHWSCSSSAYTKRNPFVQSGGQKSGGLQELNSKQNDCSAFCQRSLFEWSSFQICRWWQFLNSTDFNTETLRS